MKIKLLGTGAAWPDELRNPPGFLIENNDKKYLIECGPGITIQILKAGYKPTEIDNVFLTHSHIDHCCDFPYFVKGSYLTSRPNDINVYGPVGTIEFIDNLMNRTFSYLKPFLLKRRNREIKIFTKEFRDGKVFEEDNLIVECKRVIHESELESIAYKFTANDKSIVITGDLEPSDSIIALAKDVDILLINCSFPEDSGLIPGHCTPSQIGELANKANVKTVVLAHLFPPHRGKEEQTIAEIKKHFNGEIIIGTDFDTLEA